MTKKAKNDDFKDLRRKAERKLKRGKEPPQQITKEEALKTLHELHVHQIELEMQNEQLRETQIELQESNSRYTDLFDFAPTGYFVLNKKGNISQVNLTGTSLLGVERKLLVKKPFAIYVGNEDKDKYYLTNRQVLSTGTSGRCDLKILRKDESEFFAELLIEPVKDAEDRVTGSRIAVVDITQRKTAELKLIENEERLKLVIESGNAGTWNWEIQTRQTLWNDRLYEIMGLSPGSGNITSETFLHHIHPQDLPQVQKNLSRVLKSETDFEDTFRIMRSDGGLRWVSVRARLFRDKNQKPFGMMWVIYDVTERKVAEEAIRKSEEKFHGLFTTMSEAFILFELIRDDAGKVVDCRMLDANPAVEEMTGLRPADIIGRTIMEVFPKTDKFWFDAYGKVETTGKPKSIERLYKPLDRFYYTSIYKPAPGRVAVVFTDVTERKKAEKAMYQEKESYRTLAENLPGLVYRIHLGEQHRMEFFNQSLVELTGYTQAELTMGEVCSIDTLILAEDRNMVVEAVQQAIREHHPFAIEYRLRTKSGKMRHFTERGKPIYAPDGTCTHLDGVIFDITKRKEAEQALRLSERRLRLAQTSAGAGVWDWDIATGKLEWSEELFDLFGLDPAKHEASFETWKSILHPDDRFVAEERIETAIKSHAHHDSEYRIVLESGRVRWINSLGDTIYDDQGKPQRMSGICLDVTARKEAEEALRQSNEELNRFNRAAVGRELRMIELKKEVNELYSQSGQPPQYSLEFLNDE